MTQPSITQHSLAVADFPPETGGPLTGTGPDVVPDVDPGTGRIRAAVRRHPMITFFVLACALSWWAGILYLMDLSPVPIAGFGPFLAALTVLTMTEGRPGARRLLRSMVQWRVPARST
jgi:hypothetical protein